MISQWSRRRGIADWASVLISVFSLFVVGSKTLQWLFPQDWLSFHQSKLWFEVLGGAIGAFIGSFVLQGLMGPIHPKKSDAEKSEIKTEQNSNDAR